VISKPYHHGNLVDALLAAAVEIIDEHGVEKLSMRELARRAGVSSGAPFQHFPTKAALLTAVAEQAMGRLTEAVLAAEREVNGQEALANFEAIGRGYLRWALSNPTHFVVISSRSLINFRESETLQKQNDDIRDRMVALLRQAVAENTLSPNSDVQQLVLAARAFVYGLARMAVDGHFPEWHVHESPNLAAEEALHMFIEQLRT
jgi:AcrR family transcriptional regulator